MSVTDFIPEVWAKTYLTFLKKELVFADVVNRDYQGEIKNMGDTVHVLTPAPVTITAYTRNSQALLPQILSGTSQPMNIDQADYFYFGIDDLDEAQKTGNLMNAEMEDAAYRMRNTIDSFIATTMAAGIQTDNTLEWGGVDTSTTNPAIVGGGTDDYNAYDVMVDLGTRMNLANVPGNGRFLIVDPYFVGWLLKDPRFSNFSTANSWEVMKEGSSAGGSLGSLGSMLKKLTGFEIRVSNNVPVSGSVYHIMAGHRSAVSFASQIADKSPEAFRLQTGFADVVRGLQLYGSKAFRPECLADIYVQYNNN